MIAIFNGFSHFYRWHLAFSSHVNINLIGVTLPEIKLEVKGNIGFEIPLELGLHDHFIKFALDLIHGILIKFGSLHFNNTTHIFINLLKSIVLKPFCSTDIAFRQNKFIKISSTGYIRIGNISKDHSPILHFLLVNGNVL